MRKIATFLTIAALCWCALAGAGLAGDKVIVATDTNFKPFSFKNAEGVYTGFDVEAAEWQYRCCHRRNVGQVQTRGSDRFRISLL